MSDAERRIWYHLRHRALGVRFRRQHPIGPYIADFAAIEERLVIEIDGSQHRGSKYDTQRDEHMRSQGWTVLRFWSWDVIGNLEGVLGAISDLVPLSKGGPSEPSSDEGG
jgi:primosomal protein N' (replication factor Y)